MNKVLGIDELKKVVAELKEKEERIVFTNGCFDILHIGHIRLLRWAKRMGDVLIVGLNSDTSVSSIKEKRPIIGESERAEVLSALEPVDYITIFDEPEPTSLIRVIEPDVLIKGGDWKQDEIKGAEFAKETKIFPYLSGWSTTEIIERCRRSFLC